MTTRGRFKGQAIDLESMVKFFKGGVVSKTIIETKEVEISLFCMATGQSLSEHTSSRPAMIHILRGRGEVALAGETYEAKANMWFYIPRNLPHTVYSKKDMAFLLILSKK